MHARPHDALFRSAFEAPAHAAALLRELLPPSLRALVEWHTLSRDTASFVDVSLADQHGDLLFFAQLKTPGRASIGFLLEHQSTLDRTMPLRALSYQTRIWTRFRKERRTAPLPPGLAVVVSHARGGWRASHSLTELFDPGVLAIPDLSALVPRLSLLIDDLTRLSNRDLQARKLPPFPKLALWMLRDARAPRRLLDSFDAWADAFAELERAPAGREAITSLFTYAFEVVDLVHHDELHAKLEKLGTRTKETAMTIAQMWHDEGQQEGRRKGRQEGRREGRREGRQEGQVAMLRRLLVLKFGARSLHRRYNARLDAATSPEIDRYLRRVLKADSIAAVFDD